MRPFAHRRIVLGITGGIASYKAAWLARLLTKAGAEVDVVMTPAAREFIGPVTFEALTGQVFLVTMVARLVTLWGRQGALGDDRSTP